MYGQNYGYRSGLNQSMVRHLKGKTRYLEQILDWRPGDQVELSWRPEYAFLLDHDQDAAAGAQLESV